MKRQRSLRSRVEKLEEQAQLEGEEEQAVEIVLWWPEDPLYHQSVARAREAKAGHGQERIVLRWPDGTLIKPP